MASNDTDSEASEDSVAAFLSSFVFNFVIALVIILIYSVLRPKFDTIYQPRFKLLTEFLHDKIPEKKLSLLKKVTLPSSLFAWLTPAFKLNDDELYEVVGFDAFVYLRFLRLCFKVMALALPYAAIVLIPVNVVDGKAEVKGIDKLTLGNIEDESHKLWAHLIGVWMFSFILYYFIYAEWNVYVKYRQIYLKEKREQHFSVLVTQLPSELNNDDELKAFVEKLFPGKVAHAHIIRDLEEYRELVKKHDEMVLKLEHAQAVFEEKGERPEHKLKPLIGEKVDSINYFDEQLRETQQELEKANNADEKLINAALVTFKSVRDATIGSAVLWKAEPFNIFVEPAPEPSDVIWGNLTISVYSQWIRWAIIAVCLFFLVIFWMIPVGLVSSLVSLQSLQEKVSFLEFVNDLPTVLIGIIEGVLSTIALVIFFAILPMLLAFMSKKEGVMTNSGVQKSVIGKMFIFTIVNKFLMLVLAGAFLNQIQDILDDPGSLPSLLAQSMPAMALFFTNFAMLQSLLGHALRLLRIAPLIVVNIKTKWLAKTPRELKNVWAPPSPNYGVMYPNDLYIFVIGVSYCIQAPYVIPFVMLYFGFGYIVHFYSMVYVMKPPFNSGGRMWPKAFNRMLVAIVVFQILMIGVFGLKKNPTVSALSLPPIFLTVIFKIIIVMYFERIAESMELDNPTEADKSEESACDVGDDYLQAAHNCFIATTKVPGLFVLSTDDQDSNNKNKKDAEDSADVPNQETTKLVEADSALETSSM